MTLDLDTTTHCTRCRTPFENFDGFRIGVGGEAGWGEVICPACDRSERIGKYRETGEMTAQLGTEGAMAHYHLVEQDDLSRLRPTTAAYYRNNAAVLLEIAEKNNRIIARARQWELDYWLGKLQTYYRDSPTRSHSLSTDTYKALLWGCAGRVLLTLQDRYPKGDPKSKFGGAWITLIFDETSAEARGGVQGYCATLEEALGLLEAASPLPAMQRDDQVTMAGL